MEFKRVLFLKKQMAQKLGRGSPELGEQDIFAMDALTLAYTVMYAGPFLSEKR